MDDMKGKRVLVVGLGASGKAAGALLLQQGAYVTAVDMADSVALRRSIRPLIESGAEVKLGINGNVEGEFDLAVVSPGVSLDQPLVEDLRAKQVPVIGELELGWRYSLCPNIAITGTNGKTTTTELVAALLNYGQHRTLAAGNIGVPVCSVACRTRELDILTLEVSSFQLEAIDRFRPSIAVLTNLTPDHLDRHHSMGEYIQAKSRIFNNQHAFDWAIVQEEALMQMTKLGISLKSKVVTFSAHSETADLFLDRSLIVSKMPGWSGLLLNLEDYMVHGVHNAQNLMAAFAVGRVMGLGLKEMREALLSYKPRPHRCEFIAERNEVKFFNDSKGTNIDALRCALKSMPRGATDKKNVWLIAGGQDKDMHFHDAGPELSKRVKEALLIGEAKKKIHAAWGLFTTCTSVDSLAECVSVARRKASPGDVVLLSPACASFDMFENYQARGDAFRELVLSQ